MGICNSKEETTVKKTVVVPAVVKKALHPVAEEPKGYDIVFMMNVCIAAALRAGNEIRAMRDGGIINVEEKGSLAHKGGAKDFVTNADKKAQRIILSMLRAGYGAGLNIVAEEDDMEFDMETLPDNIPRILADGAAPHLVGVHPDRVCVFIDPLDATNEFVSGNAECVMALVGIAIDGTPVGGVCYQPFVEGTTQGTLTWALVGARPLETNVASRDPIPLGYSITMSKSDNPVLTACAAALNPNQIVRSGGSGFKTMQVIRGPANVQLATFGTKLWDTCAPHAVLRALGGEMSDMLGRPISYTMWAPVENLSVVATLGVDHAAVVALLAVSASQLPDQVRKSKSSLA